MRGIIITYLFCILIYVWVLKWGGAERLAKWMYWLPLAPSRTDSYKLSVTLWFIVVTILFLIDILK